MLALIAIAGSGALTFLACWMERHGRGREARRVARLNADLAGRRWWLSEFARKVRA